MQRIAGILAKKKAQLSIGHDKAQSNAHTRARILQLTLGESSANPAGGISGNTVRAIKCSPAGGLTNTPGKTQTSYNYLNVTNKCRITLRAYPANRIIRLRMRNSSRSGAIMSGGAFKILVVLRVSACRHGDGQAKRLQSKHQITLSERSFPNVATSTDVTVRFRNGRGELILDDSARLLIHDNGRALLVSEPLAAELLRAGERALLFLHLEQAEGIIRAIAHLSSIEKLEAFAEQRPELRLAAYDLPPTYSTEIEPSSLRDGMDADGIYEVLLSQIQTEDPKLFTIHTEKFLNAPHLLVPLLSHLASLSAEDNLKFPIQVRRLSDQFRSILEMKASPIRIHKVERNHLEMWAEADKKQFAFLDGGVATIAGLPGSEPTALRVGVYCVRAGDTDLSKREEWSLVPYIVGDIIDKDTGVFMEDDEQIDVRRLGEAARYTLELLTALKFVERHPAVEMLFLHGPLVNTFVMYDEGKPHFIPFIKEEFLSRFGISTTAIEDAIAKIPSGPNGKTKMSRQFMAVYGYLLSQMAASKSPLIGVVERSAGSWLAQAVLQKAVEANIVKQDYKRKVLALLKRYNISDDFLFGCALEEGEYITPTPIAKNEKRRAREIWQDVVAQYERPFATLLKTTETSFPFRVEMNDAGAKQESNVMRTLYHTARLLPRYAFPVGLDIVDKYAKVPDWLSKNVSARMAARVLNRTIAEGDARLVAQVRLLLAHTPRDFFYRPKTD